MRQLSAILLPVAAVIALCQCRRTNASHVTDTKRDATPGSASNTAAHTSPSVGPGAPASRKTQCNARRPFPTFAKTENRTAPLTPSGSYAHFNVCELLATIYPDFDPTTELSQVAGGLVRAERLALVPIAKEPTLAVLYFLGEDAEAPFVCGSCTVHAHLALIERRLGSLHLVAKTKPQDATFVTGLVGELVLDTTSFAVSRALPWIAVRTTNSMGTWGGWSEITLYHRAGTQLARAMTAETRLHETNPSGEEWEFLVTHRALPSPAGLRDIVATRSRKRCRFDEKEGQRCDGNPLELGRDVLRFDGKHFRAKSGRGAPVLERRSFE